jgi:hypothetical protein
MTKAGSGLWALTAFYNPCGYRRRLENFKTFRDALSVPLVAIEASFGHQFALEAGDADVVVHVPATSILWQKERLLNVALRHVPLEARAVAWLDCDVLFRTPSWPADALAALEEAPLVQLFSHLHDLPPHASSIPDGSSIPSGTSISFLRSSHVASQRDVRPDRTVGVRRAFGMAWAARRAVLDRHGFYDALIIGSGDRAMACAAFGRYDDAIRMAHLDATRRSHYLSWAEPWHRAIGGRVGCLEGDLFHLWHGSLAHRRYVDRHAGLASFSFDPSVDISADDGGAWRWATDKPALHAFLADYFRSRQEDGQDLFMEDAAAVTAPAPAVGRAAQSSPRGADGD